MRTLIKITIAAAFAAGALVAGTVSASADPITCPEGQALVLNPSDGGWVCENHGGHTNNSEDSKFGKNKF